MGTSQGLSRDVWGDSTSTSSSWISNTSWGDGWSQNELERCIQKTIKCFSDPELLNGELAKTLSISQITGVLKGIRFLCKKAQWYDDYVWIRYVPFVQILCSQTGGMRTMSFIEPELNTYSLAEKNFRISLKKYVAKDFVFINPL